MNHALLVRVVHGLAHLNEQAQPRTDVEPQVKGEFRDRPALDVLHGEEGLWTVVGLGSTRLVDLGDPRMVHQAENLSLPLEAPREVFRDQSRADQLQGDRPFRIVLTGEVDLAHPALGQQAFDAVPADPRSGDLYERFPGRLLEEIIGPCVLGEERLHLRLQCKVAAARFGQKGLPLCGEAVERLSEKLPDPGRTFWGRVTRHGSSPAEARPWRTPSRGGP